MLIALSSAAYVMKGKDVNKPLLEKKMKLAELQPETKEEIKEDKTYAGGNSLDSVHVLT